MNISKLVACTLRSVASFSSQYKDASTKGLKKVQIKSFVKYFKQKKSKKFLYLLGLNGIIVKY